MSKREAKRTNAVVRNAVVRDSWFGVRKAVASDEWRVGKQVSGDK
jgi:hypothetical protein